MVADERCVSVLRYADVDHQLVRCGPSCVSGRRRGVDKIIAHLTQGIVTSNRRFSQWLTLNNRQSFSVYARQMTHRGDES